MATTPPIGFRQNNPLNIEYNPNIPWQGRLANSEGGRFEWFESLAWGYRAAARILISYQDKYGIRTLEAAITRWAPPVENHTDQYIAYVAERSGFGEKQELDFHDGPTLDKVMRAMAEVELGREWAEQTFVALEDGLKLAGAKQPRPSAALDPRYVAPAAAVGAPLIVEAIETAKTISASGVTDWIVERGWLAGLMLIGVAAAVWLILRARQERKAEG